MKKPLVWSLAWASVWIGVAIVVGYAVSPIHSTPLDLVRRLQGGIVAAPAIAVLVGYNARRFSYLSRARRFWLALGDLYLATYLFLLATGIGQVGGDWIARGHVESLRRPVLVDPLLGTILGLTYTGFVVVLLPLSYLNHLLIGKAWRNAAE